MEVGRRNNGQPLRPEPREMVIAIWRDLGEPAVGAHELRKIQEALRQTLGNRRAPSPAAIARILADAEAELRHPEVIECDAAWRAAEIEREAGKFEPLNALLAEEPLRLKQAESLIRKLEKLRNRSEDDDEVRMLVIEGRQAVLAQAESESVPEQLRTPVTWPGRSRRGRGSGGGR